jgi:hypothetical protein
MQLFVILSTVCPKGQRASQSLERHSGGLVTNNRPSLISTQRRLFVEGACPAATNCQSRGRGRTAMLAPATAHDHLTRARCAVGYSDAQVAPRTTCREARWHAPLPAASQMLAARAPTRVLRSMLSLFARFRSSRARTRSGCEKLSVNFS